MTHSSKSGSPSRNEQIQIQIVIHSVSHFRTHLIATLANLCWDIVVVFFGQDTDTVASILSLSGLGGFYKLTISDCSYQTQSLG